MSTSTDSSSASDAAAMTPAVAAPVAGDGPQQPRQMLRERLAGLKGGDLGSLPVIVGLVVIVVVFQSLNPTFLNAFNLVNLCLQIAAVGIIATGVTLVLLLGEIDLSIGSVSGLAAAILAVLNVNQDFHPVVAVLAAAAGGLVIGTIHGLIFTKLGVPSFIVTLAGLLVWQGMQLQVLGSQGTINLPPSGGLQQFGRFSYLADWQAYGLAIVLPLLFLGAALLKRSRRTRAGLANGAIWMPVLQAVLLLVVLLAVVAKLALDRGVPWIFVVFVGILAVVEYVLRRTRYGRAIFAVGGNIEAARRAGIKVDALRTSVFAIASMLAAVGGTVAAMRLGFANQGSGAADTLINAIAAAVIGGTSLFGGRSRMYSALLGALVIGAIANGLDLLNLSSALRYIITGTVLLLAVVIDALASRGRRSAGR
jgi:D-xylose transport system permease protein